ncbi:MAG: hypothetical protein M1820_003660 [Bogoriella megaspora]|nr:MAG: hypothetical protein M1820_003660 [Bogoriella megaspora]
MATCDFCFTEIFRDSTIIGKSKPHHRNANTWETSIEEGCDICALLLQQVTETLAQQSQESTLVSGEVSTEGILKCIPTWPVYEVTVEELGAQGQVRLLFRPPNAGLADDAGYSATVEFPPQPFLAYTLKYETSTAPKLQSTTNSERTFAQINEWITDCSGPSHPYCGRWKATAERDQKVAERVFVPTRLLHISGENPPTVRLIETEPSGFNGAYTTLSNYNEMLGNIPFKAFPPSFQQAMLVTQRLGLEHLWIDSLCIIQRDDDDWAHEAPHMAEVYSNSFCNIAAVNARGAGEGLFRRRRPIKLPPATVQASWGGKPGRYKVVRDDFWTGELLAEPLYRRAWVFQERMLAPRILHFGKRQVFWQCMSLTASEMSPQGLSQVVNEIPEEERRWRGLLQRIPDDNLSDSDKAELRRIWRIAVRSYTSCDLTKKTDKLMAIAGIATQISRALGEKYVAGLWRSDLENQLGWVVQGCQTADGKRAMRQSLEAYRAPSWAWPSVDGVIEVPLQVRRHHHYRIRILGEPQIVPRRGHNEFGQLLSGSLRAQGQIFSLSFSLFDTDRNEFILQNPSQSESAVPAVAPESSEAWMYLYPDEKLPLQPSREGVELQTIQCLVLMLAYSFENSAPAAPGAQTCSGQGLAIQRTENHGVFSRIGLVKFREVAQNQWRLIEESRVNSTSGVGTEEYDDVSGHTLILV